MRALFFSTIKPFLLTLIFLLCLGGNSSITILAYIFVLLIFSVRSRNSEVDSIFLLKTFAWLLGSFIIMSILQNVILAFLAAFLQSFLYWLIVYILRLGIWCFICLVFRKKLGLVSGDIFRAFISLLAVIIATAFIRYKLALLYMEPASFGLKNATISEMMSMLTSNFRTGLYDNLVSFLNLCVFYLFSILLFFKKMTKYQETDINTTT